MPEPDHPQHDRLSTQTVHDLLMILTVLRGQEHLVRRWVRLRETTDGFEKALERLALTDALIERLAAELLAREVDAKGAADAG